MPLFKQLFIFFIVSLLLTNPAISQKDSLLKRLFSSKEKAFSLRIGYCAKCLLGASDESLFQNLENKESQLAFKDIYNNEVPILLFNYEWDPSYIPLTLKVGTGLLVTTGRGIFIEASDLVPKEKFIFLTLPFSLSGVYRAQFVKNQFFVPHLGGGLDVWTFCELRNDRKNTKFGGSFTGHLVLGGSLSLNFLSAIDPHSVTDLRTEYNVKSIWLTMEWRSVFHVMGEFDFSSQFINMGFTLRL